MNPKSGDKNIEIVASENSHTDILPEITDPDIKLAQMQDTIDVHTDSEVQKIEELTKTAEDTSHEKESFWSKNGGWVLGGIGAGAFALNWIWGSNKKKKKSESNKIPEKNSTIETVKDNTELNKESISSSGESKVPPEENKSVIDSVEDTVNSAKDNINQIQGIFDKVTSLLSSKK